jgi:hypothetical protein
MTDKQDDIFSEENEVKSSFIQWGKPGDHIVGTLVDKREVENQLADKAGEMQTIYELKVDQGEYHVINADKSIAKDATPLGAGDIWSIGGKKAVDSQMRNVKIGQKVGMKYMEETPSKTKGYNPTKVIKIYTSGKMDEEWLKEQDPTGAAEAAKKFDELDQK